MADYPDLIPSSRRYSLGDAPATASEWLGALEVVHRFGDDSTGHRLSLAYDDATTDAEWLTIRNHWAGQEGGTLPFAVPAQVWCGHTGYGDVVGGLQWRYASPPQRSDRDGRLGAGTVELVAERISQPLLSDGAAPWFGAAVPLVAEGSDPGPLPPVVPVGTPEYVLSDVPPEISERPAAPAFASRPSAVAGGGATTSNRYVLGPPVGDLISLNIDNREPDGYDPPGENVVNRLSRAPLPGDPLDYTAQCASPGTARWYFVPDVDDAAALTQGKTAQQITDMLKDEYGVTATPGTTLETLKALYAKAAEAADYGILPVKYDTIVKLQSRIDAAKSKGKQRGEPIPMQADTSNPATAPAIYGGGRILIEDACGTSYGNWLQVYPIGSSAWKGRTTETVMVQFDSDGSWGTLGGVTPVSTSGFFMDNKLIWTYTDDGELYLVGGGSQAGGTNASREPPGLLRTFKVVEANDEYGHTSGTYAPDGSGGWVYTPPSP
jgi:hypothetical protein